MVVNDRGAPQVNSEKKYINPIMFVNFYKPGLVNVRPATHMRPVTHLNVASKHFLGSLKDI